MPSDLAFPNVRHLYAVKDVALSHRINIAADRVHLSQPAVTQAVSKMERALSAPLFDRRPDGMHATEVGKIFLNRVTRALDFLKEGERLARKRRPNRALPGDVTFIAFRHQFSCAPLWPSRGPEISATQRVNWGCLSRRFTERRKIWKSYRALPFLNRFGVAWH